MKNRITQIVGLVIMCGAITGASQIAFAQDDLSKRVRKDAARQTKIERDYAKLDSWLEQQEYKRAKEQHTQEQQLGKFAARNSAVNVYTPGTHQVIGYFDRSNRFRRDQ